MSLVISPPEKIEFYSKISRFGFLRKYSYKFLFIAFLGIHIPLIGLVVFVFSAQNTMLNSGLVLLITLILTLLATGVTLFFLNRLLSPLIASKNALEAYVEHGIIPELPEHYEDEAGILMNMVQKTVTELDELVRSKDDMVSLISHDMRKPIGYMINYAEILKSNHQDEQVATYSNRIIKAGNEQIRMLDSVLGLLQQQGVAIKDQNRHHQDVRNVIHNALEMNWEYAEVKEVEIITEMKESAYIVAHFDLLVRVMNNLIHNAIKFSEKGSMIKISVDKQECKVLIHVIDYGIGFNPIDHDRIFDRFTDKGQIGTASEASTGLGLYVSKRIVEKHNGTLSAKSMGKGLGSVFTIQLPLAGWSDHS